MQVAATTLNLALYGGRDPRLQPLYGLIAASLAMVGAITFQS